MSLVGADLDSLPYIDPAPLESDRAAAHAQIESHLPPDWATTPHPSLPSLAPTSASTLASTSESPSSLTPPAKLSAIDLTRYESSAALSAPTSSPSSASHAADWRATIQRACTLHAYLAARTQQLSLLEAYGKNAWLVGNSQVEDALREAEQRLAEARESVEEVNRGRNAEQEGVRGEVEGLQESWREGVRRLVGVMVATAELGEGHGKGEGQGEGDG